MRSVEQRMANMAIVCACIVALSHVGYCTDVGSAGWWFVRLTRNGICCLAVPFFFMVSGYFLSRHFGEPRWWPSELRKRGASLLVPYLVWCALFFLFARVGAAMVKVSAGTVGFWDALRFPVSKLPLAFGARLDATPMLVPTWYIRALIIIVLLSPVLSWLSRMRRAAWFALAVFFLAYVAFGPHRNGLASTGSEHFFYYGLSLMGIVYFHLGVMMRSTRLLERTLSAPPMLGVALLVCGVAILCGRVHLIAATGGEPFPLLCVAIPFLVAGLWIAIPASPWPRWLTSLSFPVYVMHFFVVYAMDGFHAAKCGKSICAMLLQTACCIAVPAVVALVLRRFAPPVARFMFGGR